VHLEGDVSENLLQQLLRRDALLQLYRDRRQRLEPGLDRVEHLIGAAGQRLHQQPAGDPDRKVGSEVDAEQHRRGHLFGRGQIPGDVVTDFAALQLDHAAIGVFQAEVLDHVQKAGKADGAGNVEATVFRRQAGDGVFDRAADVAVAIGLGVQFLQRAARLDHQREALIVLEQRAEQRRAGGQTAQRHRRGRIGLLQLPRRLAGSGGHRRHRPQGAVIGGGP